MKHVFVGRWQFEYTGLRRLRTVPRGLELQRLCWNMFGRVEIGRITYSGGVLAWYDLHKPIARNTAPFAHAGETHVIFGGIVYTLATRLQAWKQHKRDIAP